VWSSFHAFVTPNARIGDTTLLHVVKAAKSI
jgi:hypothetical protein